MKKLLLCILLKTFYGMEPDTYINSTRVTEFLEGHITNETKVYFNAEAKKNQTSNRMRITVAHNSKNIFFRCGSNVSTLISRIEESKYDSILKSAREYNKKNNITIETQEAWEQRNKKHKKQLNFIPVENTNEIQNIFHYNVFFNAFNSAICLDNEDISYPPVTCNICIDDDSYEKKYDQLPDNLKKLCYLSKEQLYKLVEFFKKNDNETYAAYQLNLKLTAEEKKKQVITDFVNKKKEEGIEKKKETIIEIINTIINKSCARINQTILFREMELFLENIEQDKQEPNKPEEKNKIIIKCDLALLKSKPIKVGDHTLKFFDTLKEKKDIHILDFLRGLIAQVINDGNTEDISALIQEQAQNKNIYCVIVSESKIKIPSFTLMSVNNKTKKEMDLFKDPSFSTTDSICISQDLMRVPYEELEPYIKTIKSL